MKNKFLEKKMENKEYLAYVRLIGANAYGQNEYEFFFIFWIF